MNPYTSPAFKKTAFNCSYCNAFAEQYWYDVERFHSGIHNDLIKNVHTSTCFHCTKYTLWIHDSMIYPLVDGVPNPHTEMPEDVKFDYEEARSIVSRSPRGAAALLRLAIQKLTEIILDKDKGKNLNDNIKKLVENGMSSDIQKASDFLRVIGNNTVHPGLINIKDNRQVANSLFELLNIIVETMISEPNKISNLYNSLPDEEKSKIEKRNIKSKAKEI